MAYSDDGEEGTTVVITTHYTEEAMQAHKVGTSIKHKLNGS